MEQTARYVLQNTFKYASRDGEHIEAQFIEMNAPTGRHSLYTGALRQGIVHALVEDREREEASEAAGSIKPAPEPSADPEDVEEAIAPGIDIVNILARGTGDLGKIYLNAKELFVKRGILRVDGEVNMTATLLDGMVAQDFETLVGSYIANFILPS